ncbi:adenosine deaminase [Propioniciclava soli]|uniref:adenosine deaminase n=1 Tax=Propioniciclava soli TaxID=2775081 RepID=UPI001E3D1363|nr:adenosine deaminase [Propioniciclava soli]
MGCRHGLATRAREKMVSPPDFEPEITVSLSPETIAALPKVVLHDHLDGGLRASTVFEIAQEIGHPLPADDPDALATWFYASAESGTLVEYLETFVHTIAVMQTAAHLERVAREWVVDLAADGVVYGEARWAPEQHTAGGLTLRQAVAAVGAGLRAGMADAAASGTPMVARQLVTSLRHTPPSREVADLARFGADDLVVGFDLAGPEDGFPAGGHHETFAYLADHLVPVTIHAGEAAGVASIAGAIAERALRLGHGARLVEDIAPDGDGWSLGPVATWVRDRRIPLELSPTSNLQTGVCATVAEHPFGLLERLGFVVTVNCDNRLMSRTSPSREMGLLVDAFGYDLADLRRFTVDAARAGFLPHPERERLVADVIEPGYAAASEG